LKRLKHLMHQLPAAAQVGRAKIHSNLEKHYFGMSAVEEARQLLHNVLHAHEEEL